MAFVQSGDARDQLGHEKMAQMNADTVAVSILLPAAGCGSRANLGANKLLAPLAGEPILVWTLRALLHAQAMPDDCVLREIVLAIRDEDKPQIESCIARSLQVLAETATSDSPRIFTVSGGVTRQNSVRAALSASSGELIAVHDAARPLVAPETFARVVQSARENGAAIAAAPASDTVKLARENSEIEGTLPRNRIWLAQTPQVFRRELLESAFAQAARDDFDGTDCASLVERLHDDVGQSTSVRLVESDAENFKVTFAADIARAETVLHARGEIAPF